MELKFNKKSKEGEIIFSWKEIWILIKNKKLTLNALILDQLTYSLISLRQDMAEDQKIKKD
jgi:hypothetical protein